MSAAKEKAASRKKKFNIQATLPEEQSQHTREVFRSITGRGLDMKPAILPETTAPAGGRPPRAYAPTMVDAQAPTDAHQPIVVDAHQTEVDAHQTRPSRSQRRGDRHAQNRRRVHFRLDKELSSKIEGFCFKQKIELQEFFELAGVHFLECVGAHQTAMVGAQASTTVGARAPHDDLMIYKTSDDIIMLYRNYTGNRWKPKDDSFGVKYNGVDRRLVECGVLNTLITVKGKKINSFEYFTFQINDLIEVKLPTDTLDIMLQRRREQWQQLKAQKFQT